MSDKISWSLDLKAQVSSAIISSMEVTGRYLKGLRACYFCKINSKNLSRKHIHIKRGQSGVPCLSAAAQLAALSVIPPTTALASATKLLMLGLLTSHSRSLYFCSHLFYYYRWLLSPSQTNTTTVLNNTTSPHNCCCCGYLGSVLSTTAAFSSLQSSL